jgi:hypothetical protein
MASYTVAGPGMSSQPESREHRQLHLQLEQAITKINSEQISSVTGDIRKENFINVAKMVACLRAHYLHTVLELGSKCHSECISTEAALELKNQREAYAEAIQGFEALEHALHRGYISLAG